MSNKAFQRIVVKLLLAILLRGAFGSSSGQLMSHEKAVCDEAERLLK